jgi:hypothetical protein
MGQPDFTLRIQCGHLMDAEILSKSDHSSREGDLPWLWVHNIDQV